MKKASEANRDRNESGKRNADSLTMLRKFFSWLTHSLSILHVRSIIFALFYFVNSYEMDQYKSQKEAINAIQQKELTTAWKRDGFMKKMLAEHRNAMRKSENP